MSEILASASPIPPAEVVATYGLASFDNMYRFGIGLEEESADVMTADRDAAPGEPVVLKRGAVAINTESSGGW